MRKGSTRIILLALIGCLAASTATASIYLDQTRSFSLSATPNSLIHYEGQPYGLPLQAATFNESAQLLFLGAPPTTLVQHDESYVLSGVTFSLASTLSASYQVGAYDSDWFSDCYTQGRVFTSLQAALNVPVASPTFGLEHDWQGSAGTATTFVWVLWLLGEPTFTFTSNDSASQSYTQAYNESRAYPVDPFLGQGTVAFDLSKAVNLSLLNFIPDDNYNSVSNSINQWAGTATLRYIYDLAPDPVPTPVPPAFLLFASGLGGFAVMRVRLKRTGSKRKAVLFLALAGLTGALFASQASADTFTWAGDTLLQEVRPFGLANTANEATYGMSSGNSNQQLSVLSASLSFDVPPESFTRMGVEYRLTGIDAFIDSTLTSQYRLQASDTWYSRAWASGWGASLVTAFLDVAPYSALFGPGPSSSAAFKQFHPAELSVDESGFFPQHPEAYSPLFTTAIKQGWILFGTNEVSQLFDLDLTTIPLIVTKAVAVGLGAHDDDVTDEGGMGNTISLWQGSITLNYRYTAEPVPTPVPSALLLFASGLGVAGLLRARRVVTGADRK